MLSHIDKGFILIGYVARDHSEFGDCVIKARFHVPCQLAIESFSHGSPIYEASISYFKRHKLEGID